jgi:hypothetical protein
MVRIAGRLGFEAVPHMTESCGLRRRKADARHLLHYDNLMKDARTSLSARLAKWIAPFALLFGYALLIAAPATRGFARELSLENRPIELLTFALLLLSAWLSLRLAARARAHGESLLVWGFYIAFGIALFVVGMEEIAWGQTFFDWSTPESWRAINAQQETTLHNVEPLQGRAGYFRILFALGGLIGILIGRFAVFRPIAAPALLLPWFLAIGLEAGASLYWLIVERDAGIDRGVRILSEMSELLIAIAALLYLVSNRAMLDRQWREAGSVNSAMTRTTPAGSAMPADAHSLPELLEDR